jgi:hypothetical protein
MRIKTLSLFAIFLCSILLYVFKEEQPKQDSSTKESTSKISGAYNALNFLGNRQTYPNDTLPTNAYYSAWQKWRLRDATSLKNRASKVSTSSPWRSMGPHNVSGWSGEEKVERFVPYYFL